MFIVISRIFLAIFKSKKKLLLPKKNPIVLLDSYSVSTIRHFIIKNQKYTLLDLKRREIFVLIFLKSIFYFHRYGKYSYEVCFLKYINPKVAITYIDNNYFYFNIFTHLKNIKLIFMQNGNIASNRYEINNIPVEYRKLDNYFILNYLSKVFFEKYCNIKSKFTLAGSQQANIHKKISISSITNEITLVSTFRKKNNYKYEFYNNFHIKPLIFIRNVLKIFLLENKIKFNILLVSDDPDEKIFYREIFNNFRINFIENNRNNIQKNTFAKLKTNSIYIGDSKLLTECISLGYKVMFISTRGYYTNDITYSFGWPIQYRRYGDFWLNYPNRTKAKEILSNLIELDKKEWNKILTKFKVYHFYDFQNQNCVQYLKKILNE